MEEELQEETRLQSTVGSRQAQASQSCEKRIKADFFCGFDRCKQKILNGFASAFKVIGEAFTNVGNSLEVK